MERYILWNGEIIDSKVKDGLISFDDRGYQFGDGVYEVIRIYKGSVHLLDLHLDRLFRSMKELDIMPPFTRERFIDELQRLIGQNHFDKDGNLYVQVTRGLQPRAHIYKPGLKAVYYAKIDHFPKPVDLIQNGVSVTVQEDIRWLRCDIKSLNLLPNIMTRTSAHHNGFYEPLFVRNGIVRECGASNFFLVKEGVVSHIQLTISF